MRAVIQRVNRASVSCNGVCVSEIQTGCLVLLGVEQNDTPDDVDWLTSKISRLRIFNDANGLMNVSINDIKGDVIVVSQFTLHALTKKGNRPSFIKAADPNVAKDLYENFVEKLAQLISGNVYTGIFGGDMRVDLCNDGPVTIIIDTKQKE